MLVEGGKKGGGGRKAKAGPERGQGYSPLRSDIKIIGRASPDPALFSRARSKVLLRHFFYLSRGIGHWEDGVESLWAAGPKKMSVTASMIPLV